MPTTKKGEKIKKAMQKKYGSKKGKSVYYASIVSGKLKGVEKLSGGSGKLAKARATYRKTHKNGMDLLKKALA